MDTTNQRFRYLLGGLLILVGLWWLALAITRIGYNYPQPPLTYVRNALYGLGLTLGGILQFIPLNQRKLRIALAALGIIIFVAALILWLV